MSLVNMKVLSLGVIMFTIELFYFHENNTLNLTRLQHWVTESVKIWITEDVLRLDEEIPKNEDVNRAIRIRADRLSEWINIADLLKDEYCNFQAASAIISVLDHFLFQRLKRTWKMLSVPTTK